MYVRQLESRGYAVATVARRFGTVATLYKPWSACSGCSGFEGRRPARLTSPTCASRAGYELLNGLGKVAKPANIPLPIPVLRAVREAADGRTAGPILRTRTGPEDGPAMATRASARPDQPDEGAAADRLRVDGIERP